MSETTVRAALRVAEAAAMFGVSEKQIRAAITAGELPAKNVSKGAGERVHARIHTADLQAWFQALPNA